MPRKNLKEARQLAGFTQEQFAAILKVNPGTVTGWETQDNTIRPCSIKPIKDVLGDDPHLFALEKADKVEPVEATDEERSTGPLALPQNDTGLSVQEPCHVPVVSDRVDSSDSITIYIPGSVRGIRAFMELVRRQFMALAGKASGGFLFSGLTLGLVPSAAVDPEEYLGLCSASIDTWWQWLNEGRNQKVEKVLLIEGKTYLCLAEHASDDVDYAKLAHDAFEKSLSKDSMNRGYLGQTLIFKAEASIGLDELGYFVECLEESLRIAIEIDSLKRMSQAHDVLQRIPDGWKDVKAVQNLQKDITNALVIARR